MNQIISSVVVITLLIFGCSANIQNKDTLDYYHYTPKVGNIPMQKTPTTGSFHLYGDNKENYKDEGRNGIDDERQEKLLELAAYFSPIMFKNKDYTPEPIKINTVMDILTINIWDENKALLLDSCKINFNNFNAYIKYDEKIEHLIEKYKNCTSIEGDIGDYLYFDVDGSGEGDWEKVWEKKRLKNQAWLLENRGIYAHPFIYQIEDKNLYEFIIQYWFYYPYNDAVNNHEGDWEHINVSIILKQWERLLYENTEVEAFKDIVIKDNEYGDVFFTKKGIKKLITDSLDNGKLNGLTIKRVDYYFHHNFTLLYYWKDKRYYSHKPYQDGYKYNKIYQNIEQDTTYKYVKEIKYDDKYLKCKPGTGIHPLVFIGGENQGHDQLRRWPFLNHKDTSSGGSYPFPGIWRDFGSLIAKEAVNGKTGPIVYNKNEITLLPDWELIFSGEVSALVRYKWSWLVLPIRWGYPSTKWLVRELLGKKKIDVGDNAPVGPAYNSGWNSIKETKDYSEANPICQSPGERWRLQNNHYYHNLGAGNIPSLIIRTIPAPNVILDGPLAVSKFLYNLYITRPLTWILGAPSPANTFEKSTEKKREKLKLIETKELNTQGIRASYGRVYVKGDLVRLLLSKKNQLELENGYRNILETKGTWGNSFAVQFYYLIETVPLRFSSNFYYQRVSPELSLEMTGNSIFTLSPLIEIFTIDPFDVEWIFNCNKFIRLYPLLGFGFSRFHIKNDFLLRKTLYSWTPHVGVNLTAHWSLIRLPWEVQLGYTAFWNRLDSGKNDKEFTDFHSIELGLSTGW